MNANLGALQLSEICGLNLPAIPNVSGTTTISGLLGILNDALGGNPAYSSHLAALARLAQDIIAAYTGCDNPCAKNPCAIPATRPLSEPAPTKPNVGKAQLDFKVYPVPSTGAVQVALVEELTEDIMISVHALTGQMVQHQQVSALNQKSVSLDLGQLPDGTYLISIRGGSQLPISKVLIINK
jgi:hypothetical protein